jgi:hypothetical protein
MIRWVKRVVFWVFVLVLFSGMWSSPTQARDFKVYGYATPKQGETELVYWVDYFARPNKSYDYFGKTVDKEGLWRHTFEIEYGVTDRWTLSYYADFEQPSSEDFKYVQSRGVFLRYRLFEAGQRFWDPAIYLEYYLPDHGYSENERLEARIILEKNTGPFQIRLNPILVKNLGGTDRTGESLADEGMEFEYAMGFYFKGLTDLKPGVEFYGEMGEIGDLKRLDDQEHFVFPTIVLELPVNLEFETGVGFGLTAESDDLVIKGILSYGYD